MAAGDFTKCFSLAATTLPFLGREAELARVERALRERESLLVWGLADSGKSELVCRAIERLPRRDVGWCVRAVGNGSPQEILRSIAKGFHRDRLFQSKFHAEAGDGRTFAEWVDGQTSLRLRGLIYRAARDGPYRIVLEDLSPMSRTMARIAKELIWNQATPVYAVARGWTYAEVGHAAQLYWNERLRLAVGGLPTASATELLEYAIRRNGLQRFDLTGFREDILEFSEMRPGAILKMCEAAAESRYHFEGRIKTRLLHVDYLVKYCRRGTQHE